MQVLSFLLVAFGALYFSGCNVDPNDNFAENDDGIKTVDAKRDERATQPAPTAQPSFADDTIAPPPVIAEIPDFIVPPRGISSPSINRGGSGANHDQCPSDPDKMRPGICGCGVADTDGDADTVIDCVDNCPIDANTDQLDTDGDGVGDVCDNCPFASNPEQEDADEDDVGTACDCDDTENFIGRTEGVAHYVDPATGVDTGECLDHAAPCKTISYAIFRANEGDTIFLAGGLYQESNLLVTKSLFFSGRGPTSSIIRGNQTNSIVRVPDAVEDVFVRICGVKLTNGQAALGGAVFNQENTQIINSDIADNNADEGGGIYNEGRFLLFNSTVSGNTASGDGGGIDTVNDGVDPNSLIVVNSIIDGNTAGALGGGINSDGEPGSPNFVFAFNTTVNGNTAANAGGGINAEGQTFLLVIRTTISNNAVTAGLGGGIFSTLGIAFLRNNTISGNSAQRGGGIFQVASFMAVQLSTITKNTATVLGGGIFSGAGTAINMSHIIVADQALGANCTGTGSFNSNGFNLESANSCNFVSPGDLINANADLGQLADNGGPTKTHLLNNASDAIDAGDTSCSADFDQRGLPRPVDIVGTNPIDAQARCDIGAVELQQP